jgi:N-hydroxyarylamine O-acetyltransferase
MTSELDLEAYFERIGYRGPHAVGIDVLSAVHVHHTRTISFENLNPFLRWPVLLDLQSLQQKLVREGRGGYCFEHNLLLGHVLRQLGFRVRGLAARVMWNVPEGTVMPRSHMLLLIDLEGHRYLADAGFGGLTLTAPLRLQVDVEQSTPHEPFRLIESGDGYVMQAKVANVWKSLYRFDLVEQFQADYEVTNWYLSNHPASQFVTGLVAARADRGCRYGLRGNELSVHSMDGTTHRRTLTSCEALRAALEHTFALTLPEGPELQAALERVIARAA